MSVPAEPWLSVIVPTYNGARHLAAALDSIVDQHCDDLEVIAVDDGSNDGTLDLLRLYESRLPLRIFPRARIGNWVTNTNFGVARAHGRYLSFLHQDDLWLPRRLDIMRAAAAHHPQSGLLLHDTRFIDDAGRAVGRWSCPLPRHGNPIPAREFLPRLMVQNFIAMPAPIVRHDIARAAGSMDDTLWFTADWDYWSRLAVQAPMLYVPRTLAAFRIHPASQTALGAADPANLRKQIDAVVARINARLDPADPAARHARRAANFSTAVTVALATLAHRRHHVNLAPLVRQG